MDAKNPAILPGWMFRDHVSTRQGVGRRRLFGKEQDFAALNVVVEETLRTCRMRICAYCLMPIIGISLSGRSRTATCRSSCGK